MNWSVGKTGAGKINPFPRGGKACKLHEGAVTCIGGAENRAFIMEYVQSILDKAVTFGSFDMEEKLACKIGQIKALFDISAINQQRVNGWGKCFFPLDN